MDGSGRLTDAHFLEGHPSCRRSRAPIWSQFWPVGGHALRPDDSCRLNGVWRVAGSRFSQGHQGSPRDTRAPLESFLVVLFALFVHRELFSRSVAVTNLCADLLPLLWGCPSQLRQVEAEVLCLLDSGVERGETEPADHVVRAITARNRISATVAR
jgi:hypothetical protein